MSALSSLCIVAVLAWVVLVVAAQLMTPGQSPLRMGMSGLARGPHPWLMRAAFVVRGAAALLLVAAVPLGVPAAARSLLGLALLWVWGLGSALLAVYPTDMPGEEPTASGRVHSLIASVAYVCAVAGMILVSAALDGDEATVGVARWALALALTAAAALVFQFVGFYAAARDAATEREADEARDLAARLGAAAQTTGAAPAALAAPAAPAGPLPLTLAVARPASAATRRTLGGFGDIAGLLQRIFLALVMLWTALVAAGI
jgi:hypothetical membrane protein